MNLQLFLLSIPLAVWLPFAFIYLFWVYPLAFVGSFAFGWGLGRRARGTTASAYLAVFALPLAVAVAFLAWLPTDNTFGRFPYYLGIAYLGAVAIPFSLFRGGSIPPKV